jgi:hypothetical protein
MSKPCLLFMGVNKAERPADNHTTLMVSEIHTKQSINEENSSLENSIL